MTDTPITFSVSPPVNIVAQVREIRGTTSEMADLFLQHARRYPRCRVVAENGGVCIYFEGSWSEYVRQIDDGPAVAPLVSQRPPFRSRIAALLRRALASSSKGKP